MNYKKYNDYELIYMVRENDDYSKGLLYEKYLPIIRNIVNDFYKNYQQYGFEYDDFLQEALLAFEKAIVNYNEDSDNLLYSFIVLCVRRSLITYCRNISNESKNISKYKLLDIDKCNVFDSVMVDDIIEEQELQKLVKNVIYDLPFENGVILELRLNGFTYKEIATILDIPCSNVGYKIKKAKNVLRQQLDKYYCK